MVDMPPRARVPSYDPRCPLFAGSVRLVVNRGPQFCVGRSLGICFFRLPLLPPSTSSEFISLKVGFIANTDALVCISLSPILCV